MTRMSGIQKSRDTEPPLHTFYNMASNEGIQGFVLKGIELLNRKELGRGAYGKVYTVKYCQTVCAAKEIHSILIDDVGEAERRLTIDSFLRECRQCSMLRHPNVIQFLGVYYPTRSGGANRMRLPVMVMEMMADSLTSFVEKHEKIPVHIKYSIVYMMCPLVCVTFTIMILPLSIVTYHQTISC